jgi:hypothetical protein
VADQRGSESPGFAGWNRLGKEYPYMRTIAGTGDFHRRRNTKFPTRLHESLGIFPPASFIKVSCKKTATVITQQWIDADGLFPCKVAIDCLIGNRQQLPLAAGSAFHPGFLTDAGFPLISTDW